MHDDIIEPHRKNLIPFFNEVQQAAYNNKAFACSIAGAGPSLFALSSNKELATLAAPKLVETFGQNKMKAESWVTSLKARGAYVED